MEHIQGYTGSHWRRKEADSRQRQLLETCKEINSDKVASSTRDDENKRVMEAVEEGLLQVHGTAPNRKHQGIFRILGENCNGFNNKIGGNDKITKAVDIKEDLDIDCLLYCEHRLNFRHKDNKNDLKQMFQ